MNFKLQENNGSKINEYSAPLSFNVNRETLNSIINATKSKNQRIILGDIIAQNINSKAISVLDKFSGKLLTIIFNPPIKVIYKQVSNEETLIDEYVYSLCQIDDLLKHYKIQNAYFKTEDDCLLNYFESKIFLISKEDNELTIINCDKKYILQKNDIILTDYNFDKSSLSKYFDKYFIYPNNENNFQLFLSERRKNLLFNINILLNNNSSNKPITKFKISGPSSEGKSITLLYASRLCKNIIYLNLKVLIKLYKENKIDEYLNILLYEFGRLDFSKVQQNNYKAEFEEKFNQNIDKSPWELLEILCNYLKDKGIILILDQFKDKYVSTTIFEEIKKNLNPLFKIIISSSINDKDIGEKVSASIYKNKGTPKVLNFENQDDYFYYIDLINKNEFEECFLKNKSEILIEKSKLFNYEPKYIQLLNEKTEEEISIHILKKMEEHCEKLGLELNFYIFNIYAKIGIKINYEILNIKTLSLKYCKLIFGEETFTIQYKFQFIESIVNKKIKEIDTKDYFEKQKYKEHELYNDLKGKFFEYSSILAIIKKKEFFKNNPIQNILPVKTIVGMEKYEDNETFSIYKNIGSINKVKYEELLNKNLDLINNEINTISNSCMDIDESINNKKKKNVSNNSLFKDDNSNLKNINYYYNENLKKEQKRINELILLGKKRREEIKKDPEKGIKNEKSLQKDIDKSIDIITYPEEFQNSSILITQKKITGKTLDLGFLFEKKDKKKFVGLQMKFYDKNTKLKEPITKDSIKNSIQPILMNCLENLGMKITEWHYVMCLYYNNKDDAEYNKYLIQNCKKYNIEYIFFNPLNNEFYDRDEIPFENFETNFLTNIDFDSKSNPYNILIDTSFLKKYLDQTADKSLLLGEDDLIFDKKSSEVINNLKSVLKEKNIIDIKIICKFKLIEDYHFPIPQNLFCLLFLSKQRSLLYYFNIDNELKCKDIELRKDIMPSFISNHIENNDKERNKENIYFYVLQMFK